MAMTIQRITVDVDLAKLSFADQHAITGAIATLEQYAATPHVHLAVTTVTGMGRTGPRKPRVDRKTDTTRALQPQTKIVFDFLKAAKHAVVPGDIALSTGIGESSVRGQLAVLLKRGCVVQQAGRPKRWMASV
jgi:hypothetical protein